jgi:hypothetical protein
MVGLLLAFLLRVPGAPSHDILREGLAAVLRSVVWFVALGLTFLALRSGWVSRFSLLAGTAACLLVLTINDGLLYPALAQPFWIAAALALPASTAAPSGTRMWQLTRMLLSVPVLLVLAALYLMAFYPVAASTTHLDYIRVDRQRFWHIVPDKNKLGNEARQFQGLINSHLKAAMDVDPLNATPLLQFADWSRELGLIVEGRDYAKASLEKIDQARRLDPLSTDADVAELELRLQYAALCLRLREKALAEAKKQPAQAVSHEVEAKHALADAESHIKEARRVLDHLTARDPVEAAPFRARLATAAAQVEAAVKAAASSG